MAEEEGKGAKPAGGASAAAAAEVAATASAPSKVEIPAGQMQIQSAWHQGYRRRAYCQIHVWGKDVTERFRPYLISVRVISRSEGIDECHIELDDRNAELEIPPDKAPVVVRLGWAGEGPRLPNYRSHQLRDVRNTVQRWSGVDYDQLPEHSDARKLLENSKELPYEESGMRIVFQGQIQSVESGFGRKGGGRRLWIEAWSGDITGPMKSHGTKTWGEGSVGGGKGVTVEEIFKDVGKAMGLDVSIDKSLGSLKRAFMMQNSSNMDFLDKLAKEVGGLLKFSGNKAYIVSATNFLTVDGRNVPVIEAVWGVNLIGWRIKPFTGRPQYKESGRRWFDWFEHGYKDVLGAVGGAGLPFGAATSLAGSPNAAPNKQTGGQHNQGVKADANNRRGAGWCLINGEPSALARHALLISGARPGVDGHYAMQEVEHYYTRAGGYTTRINVENPSMLGGYTPAWRDPPKGATVDNSFPDEKNEGGGGNK